jgi:hypothetical protein
MGIVKKQPDGKLYVETQIFVLYVSGIVQIFGFLIN